MSIMEPNSVLPASDVLKNHSATLCNLIQGDVMQLASNAFDEDLITTEEKNECTNVTLTESRKVNLFLECISRKIEAHPDAFLKFVTILEKEPAKYQNVAQQMRRELHSPRESAEARERKVTQAVEGVVAIASEMQRGDVSNKLGEVSASMKSTKLKMGVIGTTNSGKSTTLNALMGKELLPASFKPQTARVVCIKHDPKSPGELFGKRSRDDSKVKLASGEQEIYDFIRRENGRERSSSKNGGQPLYDSLELLVPIPFIGGNEQLDVEIFDTPGTSEAGSQSIQAIAEHVREDLAGFILVLGAGSAYETSAATLLAKLKTEYPLLMKQSEKRILVLVNKYDLMYKDRKTPSLYDERKNLAEKIGVSPDEVVFFSAMLGLQARKFRGDPNSVNQIEYVRARGDVVMLPEGEQTLQLESYSQENIEKLAAILESSSRFGVVEALLERACLNYREISITKAIDDTTIQVSELKKHAQLKIKEQTQLKDRFVAVSDQLLGCFPQNVTEDFSKSMEIIVAKVSHEIGSGIGPQVGSLSGQHSSHSSMSQGIDATRNYAVSLAEGRLSHYATTAISELNGSLKKYLSQSLDQLSKKPDMRAEIDATEIVVKFPESAMKKEVIRQFCNNFFGRCSLHSCISSNTVTRQRGVTKYRREGGYGFLWLESRDIPYSSVENYKETNYQANVSVLSSHFHQFANECGEFLRQHVATVVQERTQSIAREAAAKVLELSGQPEWQRWLEDGESQTKMCNERIQEWEDRNSRLSTAEHQLNTF